MRCWVSDFGGVNDKEREMERWRSAVASRLWMEVGSGVIVGVGWWVCGWRMRWRSMAYGLEVMSPCTVAVVRPCTKALRERERESKGFFLNS